MTSALEPIAAEVRALMPPGAEVLDVHTHLGRDEDGQALDAPGLVALLDAAGVRRACVFPLHDPERRPAYRRPNDRVLDASAASGGRLIPFCRLDPADDPIREGERCLRRGARGIKLHPRAQAFVFADGAADAIFAMAEEAGVPVLVHAGRGMPPIAEGLAAAALRHPEMTLILAHAAVADQAVFSGLLAEHPGVLYDTSCFVALDLLELMARVPPQRILFGSDPPYGLPSLHLFLTLRALRAAGADEGVVRAVLGRTAAGLLDEGVRPAPGAPLRPRSVALWGPLARVHAYGMMAFALLLRGHAGEAREPLDLALSACRDPDAGPAGAALERIARILTACAGNISRPESDREPVHLLFVALVIAATEPVAGALRP